MPNIGLCDKKEGVKRGREGSVNEGQVEESEVTEPSGMKSARREDHCLAGIKRKR
ncbi:hypothetical protein PAXRUDRAFT_826173 [Paxillus rubicundulus Ve08.2h10]|uniref:Uncharacterized protein n=1 Tax=Paxillus rubicundulus Ve08.2h10 TaxID=930991 RepID=A0A0D0EA02_9AGAM|nr:hypothetical protein PAXRUDRAFT_826173 [Paxillus rubicundulus Ve08.2h10]